MDPNHLTRRALLGGAVGLGASVALTTGAYVGSRNTAFAQGGRVRRSIHSLVRGDGTYEPELSLYIDALGALQKDHPMLWEQLKNFHDRFCIGAAEKEVHGNWSFIPWHRAFLVTYERLLREASGNDSVALPYWNWYDSDEFPEVFTKGPLNHDNRDINTRPINDGDRGFGGGDERTNYDVFAAFSPVPVAQPGNANSFFGANLPFGVVSGVTGGGRPEYGGHAGIHNYVGGITGDMSDLNTSSRDPCFYSHHCNIDRLMEVWKNDIRANDDSWRTESDAWLDTVFEFAFDNARIYRYRARDLMDTEAVVDVDGVDLGYSYDVVQPRSTAVAGGALAGGMIVLQSTPAAPAGGALVTDVATWSFEPAEQVISFGALTVNAATSRTEQIAVPDRAQRAIKDFLARDRASEFSSFSFPPDDGAAQPQPIPARVTLRLENIRLPPRNLQVNFFINTLEPSRGEVAKSGNYLATFNYIPASKETVNIGALDLDVTRSLGQRIGELDTLQISTITDYLPAGSEPVEVGKISLIVK